MNLYVPACGDRITLATPWTFTLYLERRNVGFAKAKGLVDKNMSPWGGGFGKEMRSFEVTFPAGTLLEVDRVYIRTFNKSFVKDENDFDSITWKVMNPKNKKPFPKQRFWSKLVDVNQIEFDPETSIAYRDRVKLVKLVMES
jgi:hypothetical protein